MAMVRKSLKAIKADKPKIDHAKVAATTEADIRRHMREDGETFVRGLRVADVTTRQVVAKRPK